MKKVFSAALFMLVSAAGLPCIAEEGSAVAVAVSIQAAGPSQSPGQPKLLLDKARHFSVILTNVGQTPIRLWRDWCSWGYYNLSFELAGPNGNRVNISRKEKEWEKNFPDSTPVVTGGQMVIDVIFDPTIWRNLPALGKELTISLRALYESAKGKEATEHRIWTGKIASSEERYLFK